MPPQERRHEDDIFAAGDCFTRSGATARGIRVLAARAGVSRRRLCYNSLVNRPLQFIAPALAVFALAAALFAVPADEARAHPVSSAKHHAEANPLHKAAEAGDLDSVNHFLASPHAVAVDAKDGNDWTALHHAAKAGRLSVVARLIAAGANVNVKNQYSEAPLHWAVYGDAAVVATLIAAGADVDVRDGNGWTPLHHAAYGGHAAAVAALIAEGAAVDLMENNGDETPLYQAAEKGHLIVVAALIKAGADVNVRGYSNLAPLHEAAGGGHLTVALTLIAAGADVNAKDAGGDTPLSKAEAGGYSSVVSALIAAGAHWGTACAKPAVVNPAGPSQPCLCESPNVGTPGNCACPAGQALLADETCGVCPAEHRILADETCSACPVGQLLKDGACAAPTTPEEKCQAAQWIYLSATGVCGINFTIGDSVDRKAFCRFDDALVNFNPFCREVFGPDYSFPHKPADGSSPIYVYNCDPDNDNGLIPATVNTAGATACSCAVAGQTLRADTGKCVPRAALIAEIEKDKPDLAAVRSLLEQGVDPNLTVSAGVPLLFVAATLLHAKVVSVLITAGANVSAQFGLSATLVNRDGTPRPLPRFLSERVYAGNVSVNSRLVETYLHFGGAAGGAYNWRLPDGDSDLAGETLGNLALYYATVSANRAAEEPFLRRIGGYLRGVGGQCPPDFYGEDISNTPVCDSPVVCLEGALLRGEICIPKTGDFGEGLSEKFLCGIFGGTTPKVQDLPANAVQFRLHLRRVAQGANFSAAERAMVVAMSNVVQAKFDGNSAAVAAFLSAYDTGGAKYEADAYKEIIFRANLAYDPTGTFQDPRIHTGIFSEANSNELARILSFVPVDGSVHICAGMDKNGTFCMLNSADAFPCRGLFKHVRSCNLEFNRPALNPFFCGRRCPGENQALGSGCGNLNP